MPNPIAPTRQELLIKHIAPFKVFVKRKAKGVLHHDYLVPGGPYPEQWDWDGFFIGMALAMEMPSEGIFLRNWALNYIENGREDGFTPGLLTPHGPDWRLNQMKPVLAQGAFFASQFLQDIEWLRRGDLYDRLRRIVLYREERGFFDKELGLAAWTDSMESGADNAISMLEYPQGAVAACDCNCWIYREYVAMQKIASALGKADDAAFFQGKAELIKQAILRHLWNEEDGTFYNMLRETREHIRVVEYSVTHPFWAGIASVEQAQTFFARYLLNPEKLRSPWGIRTLSKDHPVYNNANIIKPHSNWQGPVWPIANVIAVMAMLNYGYKDEARAVAETVIDLCIDDVQTTGGMHENYDAETGQPLAAQNFISWNLLLLSVLDFVEQGRNPFLL